MSIISMDEQGLAGESRGLGVRGQGLVQGVAGLMGRVGARSGQLAGGAHSSAGQVNDRLRQNADRGSGVLANLQTFLQHAARTVSALDVGGARNFQQGGGR